ncbi:hypothetical protein V1525DRAFT_404096 [Lipomyces kononenkoae]|uniref:Uncharacterized protein n=1 Tax=Lipomyces kononenkoae TaxID=34357 RepID=A0ACC3T0G4_LIPKO
MSSQDRKSAVGEDDNRLSARKSPICVLSSPSKKKSAIAKRLRPPTRIWTLGDSDKVSQCLNHAETKFEDELYEYGVTFLEMVSSSHFPETFIPTPPQLSLLFTLISNPKFTTSKTKKKPRLSAISLHAAGTNAATSTDTTFMGTAISTTSARLIAKLLSSGISMRQLGFYKVFDVDRPAENLGPYTLRHKRKLRYDVADSDEDTDGDMQNSGRGYHRVSRKYVGDEDVDGIFRAKGLKMLWACAEQNLWRIFGWAFRCASAYGESGTQPSDECSDGSRTLEARWPVWKTVLGFMLDILEHDWSEAVNKVESNGDREETENVLKQTLIYSFLQGLELGEPHVRWKPAVASVFSRNSESDMQQFHPIYPNEVNRKSQTMILSDHKRLIYNNLGSHSYGDIESTQMRKRALGIIYDALGSIANLFDQHSFFRELSLYIRDLPLQTYLVFLEAPDLIKCSMTEYTSILCDSLLQVMTNCPQMPKNWIYNYENGKQYIGRYLQLSPIRSHGAKVQYMAEDVVKVALIVETLFRTWVKVRKTATGTRTRTMSSNAQPAPSATILVANTGTQSASPSQTHDGNDLNDILVEALHKGILDRRKIFDLAQSKTEVNVNDEHKWKRLDVLLKGTEIRMLGMNDNLEKSGVLL